MHPRLSKTANCDISIPMDQYKKVIRLKIENSLLGDIEENYLDNFFEKLCQLDEPIGKRLVVTQFRFDTKLVDPLSEVVRDKRSIGHSVLKGVYRGTDVIPYGYLASDASIDSLLNFINLNYDELVMMTEFEVGSPWGKITDRIRQTIPGFKPGGRDRGTDQSLYFRVCQRRAGTVGRPDCQRQDRHGPAGFPTTLLYPVRQ